MEGKGYTQSEGCKNTYSVSIVCIQDTNSAYNTDNNGTLLKTMVVRLEKNKGSSNRNFIKSKKTKVNYFYDFYDILVKCNLCWDWS